MADIINRNAVNSYGDGGQTILYAHGFGCNQSMWDAILLGFKDTHRQIVFDYVGCGQSDLSAWDREKYSSLEGYAQDILDVCDAIGLEKDVTLVGHSVSATTAMLASIERPELFSGLVLVGPTPCFLNMPPDYNGGFERPDLEGLLELMENNYLGWAEYLAPVVSGEDAGTETTHRLNESFCSTDPDAAKAFAMATFFADNRSDLPKVTTPSCILQHANDHLVPVEIGEFIQRNLKNSTLEILDVFGHCAHMSHPNLVIESMNRFLKTS